MRKCGIIIGTVLSILISGCSEVPEDVKSRTEEQKGETSLTADSGEENVREKIGNITFDCEPDPIDTEEFYILKSRIQKGYDASSDYSAYADKLDDVLLDILGVKADREKIEVSGYEGEQEFKNQKGEPVIYNPSPTARYYEEKVTAEMSVDSDSFMFLNSKDKVRTGTDTLSFLERQVYHPDSYPDTEYDMNDGTKMTIKQALEQADEIIGKLVRREMIDKNVTPVLDKIAVQKTDGDGMVISLFYRKKIYGLEMNCDGFWGTIGRDEMRYTYLLIAFAGDNDPLLIYNPVSDIIDEKEKVESVMTYQQAKERLGNGLAKNMVYTVSEAGLRYTCIYDQFQTQRVYRPMWCFVLYDSLQNDKTYTAEQIRDHEGLNCNTYYQRTTAYVDAVTGDIWYCNPFDGVLSVSKAE